MEDLHVTSNEFDAILNILEKLHSSINIIGIAPSNTQLTVAYLFPLISAFSSKLNGLSAEGPRQKKFKVTQIWARTDENSTFFDNNWPLSCI